MGHLFFLDQYGHLQGGQRVLVSALGVAVAAGYQVSAAFPLGGSLEAEVRARFGDKVELHALSLPSLTPGKKGLRDIVRLGGLLPALLKLRPQLMAADFLYVNGPRLYAPVALLTQGLSTPTPARLLHVHMDHSPLQKRLIKQIAGLKKTKAVLLPSAFCDQHLPTAKNRCLPNALDSRFSGLPFQPADDSSPLSVAVIGVLRPEKGQHLVANALQAFPDLHLHCFGGTPLGQAAYAEALKQQAPDQITLHGAVADLPQALKDHHTDTVIVPSTVPESFGLSAIEAAACSCLVVTSTQGALPEVASALGADTFDTVETLVAQLQMIKKMSPAVKKARKKEQYQNAQALFHPNQFETNLLRVLHDCCPPP